MRHRDQLRQFGLGGARSQSFTRTRNTRLDAVDHIGGIQSHAGIQQARAAIESGAAKAKMESLVALSDRLGNP